MIQQSPKLEERHRAGCVLSSSHLDIHPHPLPPAGGGSGQLKQVKWQTWLEGQMLQLHQPKFG